MARAPLTRPERRIIAAVRGASDRWERERRRLRGPAGRPGDHIIARCLALVAALAETADGMRSVEIAEQLGVSRATVDRDLAALARAGVRLESEYVADGQSAGAVRMHRLPGA